jgi:hypothetical protein
MTREQYIEAKQWGDALRLNGSDSDTAILAEAVDLLREALITARDYRRHPDYDWYQDDLDDIDAALALTAPKEDSDGA